MEDISAKIESFRDKLACPCGCGRNQTSSEFASMLYFAQGTLGKPLVITSGYRCPEHNKAVKGSNDSASIYGEHADISYSTPDGLFLIVKGLVDAGFERFRLYPHHLHIDRHPKWQIPSFAWANYPPQTKKEA